MATTTLGTAYIDIVGRTDKFGASVEKGVAKSVTKAGKDNQVNVTGRTDKFGSSIEPGILGSIKGLAGKAAAAFAAAFVIRKGVDLFKESVGFASDLNESLSKVDVVFGESAGEIKAWADTANTALGSTRQQALESAGTFGNLFQAFGIGQGEATKMSKQLVELATDLASFNNGSVDDALLALRAGLSGETEPLKRFGVALTDDRLKAEALRLGLLKTSVDGQKVAEIQAAIVDAQRAQAEALAGDQGKAAEVQDQLRIATVKQAEAFRKSGASSSQYLAASANVEKLTSKLAEVMGSGGESSEAYADATATLEKQQARLAAVMKGKVPAALDSATKAQAAFALILHDTSLAQGDFERTSGGLANQQRILAATVKDLKTQFGQFLLPTVLTVTKALAQGLPKAFNAAKIAGRAAGTVLGPVFAGLKETVGAFFTALRGDSVTADGFVGFVAGIGTAIGDLGRALAEFVRTGFSNIVAGFNGLPGDGGPASSFFHFIGEAARGFFDFLKSGPVTEIIDTLRDAFDRLAGISNRVVKFFSENENAAKGLQVALTGIISAVAVIALADQIEKATVAAKLFLAVFSGEGAFAALANPIVLLVAGIAAIGVAGFVAYRKFKPFHDLIDSIGRFIKRNLPLVAGLTGAVLALSAALLTNPIVAVVAAIVALGVAVFAAYKRFKPFRDLVDSIGRGIGTAAVATFKAIRTAIGEAAAFLGPVVARIIQIVSSIVDALGPVFARIVAVIGEVAATIGRVLGPVLSAVVGALSDLFGFIVRNAPAAFGLLQAGIAFAADVIGRIVSIAGTVAGALSTAFQAVVGFVGRMVDAIEGSAVFQFLVEQVDNFRAFLVEIAPQVKEAVGHIVNVIIAVLRPVGQTILAAFEGIKLVAGFIADAFAGVIDSVRLVVSIVSGLWARFGDDILSIIGRVFEPLVTIIRGVLSGIRLVFQNVIDVVVFLWRHWGDDLLKILKGFLAPIVAAVEFVVNTIANVIRFVLAIINGDWGKAWEAAKNIVKGAIDFVLGVLGGVLDVITGILGGIADTISGIWHNAWAGLSSVVSTVFDAVVGFVADLPGRLLGAAGDLVGFVGGLFGDAWGFLLDVVEGAVDGIVGFVKDLPGRLLGAAGDFVGFVAGLFGDGWETAVQVAHEAIDGVVSFVAGLPGRILSAAGGLAVAIVGLFGDAWDVLSRVPGAALDAVVGFVSDLPGRLAAAAVGVVSVVGDLFGSAWDALAAVARVAFDAVIGFVSDFPDRLARGAGRIAVAVVGLFGDAWDLLKGVPGAALDAIVGFVADLPARILSAAGGLVSAIVGLFGDAWDGALSVVEDAVAGIVDFVAGFPGAIVSAAGDFVSVVVGLFGAGWDAVVGVARGALDSIVAFVAGLPGRLIAAASGLVATIGGLFGTAWTTFRRLADVAIDVVVGFVRGLPGRLLSAGVAVAGAIGGLFGDAWDLLRGIAGEALDAVVGYVVNLPGRFLQGAERIIGAITGLFGDAWEFVKGVAGEALDAVVGYLTALPERFVQGAGRIAGIVAGLFGDAWDILKGVASDAIEAIVGFVTDLPGRIVTLAVLVFSAFKDLGKQIVSGILDGLKDIGGFVADIGKAVANGVISVINEQIIDRINSALSFTIDPPGPGPKFTIPSPNIPHIQPLAAGGVATRNKPVTAIIGDNKTRDEIVAPVPPGFFQAMEKIAAGRLSTDGRPLTGDVTIVESPDGRKTYSDFVKALRASQFLAGLN